MSDFVWLIRLVAIFSVGIGMFFVWRPKKAIELQIHFYRLINWKMEPVSWQREIRNTRVIGWLIAVCGILALFW